MYYQHFGLDGPPFRFSPSATPLYLSSAHRECLAALEWALVHDECGFMLLLGETGTGKTTVLNAVRAQRLPRLRLACVANPRLSFEEIMRVVLPQLGVKTEERGKLELIQEFQRAVSNRLAGHRTAIVFDEAQDLSDETLEDIRLLANRIGPQEQELQIVLMGHPELLDRLSARNLRQLRERISTKVSLLPLSPEEAAAYVEWRLAAQGGTSRIFKPKALRCLIDAAAGVPRRLNVLCHNALVLAYSRNLGAVTMDIAREVVNDYQSIVAASPAPTSAQPTAFESVRALANTVRSQPVSIPIQVEPSSAADPILLEEEPAAPPRRNSIYAAGACAAIAVVGIASLLFPTTQNWASVNRSVPAIAGQAKLGNRQVSPQSFSENKVGASTTAEEAQLDPASAPTASVGHASVYHAPIGATKQLPRPRAIQIRPGDTFHDLAIKYLGSKERAWDIIKANPQISDPNVLYVGETVYLPSLRKTDESRLVQ